MTGIRLKTASYIHHSSPRGRPWRHVFPTRSSLNLIKKPIHSHSPFPFATSHHHQYFIPKTSLELTKHHAGKRASVHHGASSAASPLGEDGSSDNCRRSHHRRTTAGFDGDQLPRNYDSAPRNLTAVPDIQSRAVRSSVHLRFGDARPRGGSGHGGGWGIHGGLGSPVFYEQKGCAVPWRR